MNTEKLKTESSELVKIILDGRLSRDMILAKMADMERKYPGIGWDVEATKLKRFWAKAEKLLRGW